MAPDNAVALYLKPQNNNNASTASTKIRCFIGGEWKPRYEFSNRQLERFDRSKGNPRNARVSCRAHSVQPVRELQCEGPCGKWLPLENFSKATRGHNKTWCEDCTEWQLSNEPGFTPYIPPTGVDDFDEPELLEDGHADALIQFNEHGERVENWIQGNPSEIGDYDKLEIGTQRSVMDSASEVSVPSLLDDSPHELATLPQALTAVNLSRVGYFEEPRPSYAAVASAGNASSTIGGSRYGGNRPDRRDTATPVARTVQIPFPMGGDDSVESQSYRSSSAPALTSDTVSKITSQDQSVVSDANTVWVEDEFTALTVLPNPRQRMEGPSGWARPVQRKTELLVPKYVMNANIGDVQPRSHQQRPVYADVDDDDSEDEC
ncbi:hypothetical protein SPI_01783 [Niveomyces insectorum RCEF 264]|uniref:Stc1 domain-containing protein n=1 Tax=Niveomyces insectorum RCEF 264 TaxID=1081102 RepID=A0A167Z8F0_9HYPO|nr:hypothetical protein SPI_01783 [Niveomyces insectorum RCEF 264]